MIFTNAAIDNPLVNVEVIGGTVATTQIGNVELTFSEISQLQLGILRNGGCYKDSVKYVDVYRERPIRLTVRVLVPVREHPKVSPDDELRLTGKCHSAIQSWKDCLISNGQNLSKGKTF